MNKFLAGSWFFISLPLVYLYNCGIAIDETFKECKKEYVRLTGDKREVTLRSKE